MAPPGAATGVVRETTAVHVAVPRVGFLLAPDVEPREDQIPRVYPSAIVLMGDVLHLTARTEQAWP